MINLTFSSLINQVFFWISCGIISAIYRIMAGKTIHCPTSFIILPDIGRPHQIDNGVLLSMNKSRKRIKVLRVIARLNTGGPAQHVIWLTCGLDPERFESILVVGVVENNEESMDYLAEREGVNLYCIPQLKRKISLHDIPAVVKIYRVISDLEPDIIHTHTSKAGFLGGLAGILYNARRTFEKKAPAAIVHTFHGHTFRGYFSPVSERIFLYIERFLSTFSLGRQVILAVSTGQKEEILSYLRLDKSTLRSSNPDVKVMPLGIDLKPFADIDRLRGRFRTEFNISKNTLIIGWVGRLTHIKNPALFLEAAGAYKKACSRPVCFVIVGGGELKNDLKKQAEVLGISDSVLLVGNRRDMRSFWADTDILVSSSNNEGTPVSILEAMACGIPVAATDVGGVGEIISMDWQRTSKGWHTVESGQPRGMLVKPQDVGALSAALKELVEKPSLRQRLGRYSPSYIKKNHSLERLISDMENLYLQIIYPRNPGQTESVT